MKWHKRFFWLLLLFLPTQLGFHFWSDWAHVLGRRVDYLSPTLYLTDIFVVITTITWFLSSRGRRRRPWRSHIFMRLLRFARNDRERKTRIVIITIILFAAVNIFVATNPMVAVYKWIKVMEFVFLGWYVIKTKPRFAAIITPLTIGVFYSSVLAIVQFFLQHSVGGVLWWLGERMFTIDTPGIARIDWYGRELLRPYATFPHPNVLGGFLAAVLPLIFMSLMSPMGQMKKRMYILSLGVGVIALFLTFSRSAIIVGGLAMVVVFFFRRKFLLLFFVLAIVFSLFTFHFSLFTSFEESVVVRQQLNVAATKLWQTSPLFGVGLGNFLVRLPETLPTRTIYFLQPVHNIYLLLLSEIGAVGIAGVVGVVWVAIRKKKRILFVPLIAYLLLGFVDHYPLTLQQGQLLFTLVAAMSVVYTSSHD